MTVHELLGITGTIVIASALLVFHGAMESRTTAAPDAGWKEAGWSLGARK